MQSRQWWCWRAWWTRRGDGTAGMRMEDATKSDRRTSGKIGVFICNRLPQNRDYGKRKASVLLMVERGTRTPAAKVNKPHVGKNGSRWEQCFAAFAVNHRNNRRSLFLSLLHLVQ